MATPEGPSDAGGGQAHQTDQIVVIGPDGNPVALADGGPDPSQQHGSQDGSQQDDEELRSITDLVEEPAKVMRIGRMVQQLLEEVKSAPVDEAGRKRLATILHTSLKELKQGLAPELDDELDRLIQPFDESTPTESELRIAQAQLVGWLEGLFHGIQTAIYAQQMAARSQLEQMRRALPPGAVPGLQGGHIHGGTPVPGEDSETQDPGGQGGMYL